MNTESPISLNIVLFCLIASVFIISVLFLHSLLIHHTMIVFCNVGKGSSVYIRVQNKVDVLINAGPDKKILSCLSSNMPFFDRTIEYVLLTTSSQSYIGGMKFILSRYKVQNIYLPSDFTGNTATDGIKTYLAAHRLNAVLLKNVSTITILDSQIKTFSFQYKKQNLYPVLFSNGTKKVLLFGHISERNINNILRSDSTYISSLYLLQIPIMEPNSNLFTSLLSLADPSVIVITIQSQSYNANTLVKLKARLQAIKKDFVIENEKKDLIYELN